MTTMEAQVPESGEAMPSPEGRGSAAPRLVLVSVDGCYPCELVKTFLPEVTKRLVTPLKVEIRQLTQDEFIQQCSEGRLDVKIVPAFLLYEGPVLVARVAGWKGKHGILDQAFLEKWLSRHGIITAGAPEAVTA